MRVTFNPPEPAGLLNAMLFTEDERPAAEQLDERYAHGGGWHPSAKATVEQRPDGEYQMLYPEDPPMREVARAALRDEFLVLFEAEFLGIMKPDGSWEVSRVD